METNLLLINLQGLLSEISACPDDKTRDECDRHLVAFAETSKLRLLSQGFQTEAAVRAAKANNASELERIGQSTQYPQLKAWCAEIAAQVYKDRGLPKRAWHPSHGASVTVPTE